LSVFSLRNENHYSQRCDALETGPFCQMGRTRRIKKLTDSSGLKAGELLAFLHCLSHCGFDAPGGLRKSIGAGVVQFYRHRQEPVPWIGRSKNGRLFRRPRTTNERRVHFSNEATEQVLESHGLAFKLRQRRNSHLLPNAHDDLSLRYQRSWKEHRGAQRKNAISINRQIHSPRFWDLVKCGGHCHLPMPSGKYRRGKIESVNVE
jgi:hypothetical protein